MRILATCNHAFRCVASSLLHAVELGYRTRLLEGGCAAYDEAQHRAGMEMIREKGGDSVQVVD